MIWLVGNAGMLGTEVAAELARRGLAFSGTDREVDITSPDAVNAEAVRIAAAGALEWIINCAAYTAVDRAEEDEPAARALNAAGPANLSRAARTLGAAVLHLSTDYVFNGRKAGAYLPDDPVDPQSAYGRTKEEGERLLRAQNPHHVIVRTSWLFGPAGKNFVSTMLGLFAEREEVTVVADQRGRPTYAADLAAALVEIARRAGGPWGTFHFANAGAATWYDFAVEIERRSRALGLTSRPCAVRPVTTAEYPRPAPRPANSTLDTGSLTRGFGITPRPWQEALEDYLRRQAHQGDAS